MQSKNTTNNLKKKHNHMQTLFPSEELEYLSLFAEQCGFVKE